MQKTPLSDWYARALGGRGVRCKLILEISSPAVGRGKFGVLPLEIQISITKNDLFLIYFEPRSEKIAYGAIPKNVDFLCKVIAPRRGEKIVG